MPDHKSIHSTSEVTRRLLYPLDSGLLPKTDTPHTERRPNVAGLTGLKSWFKICSSKSRKTLHEAFHWNAIDDHVAT